MTGGPKPLRISMSYPRLIEKPSNNMTLQSRDHHLWRSKSSNDALKGAQQLEATTTLSGAFLSEFNQLMALGLLNSQMEPAEP